jgi:hypothetical protein
MYEHRIAGSRSCAEVREVMWGSYDEGTLKKNSPQSTQRPQRKTREKIREKKSRNISPLFLFYIISCMFLETRNRTLAVGLFRQQWVKNINMSE